MLVDGRAFFANGGGSDPWACTVYNDETEMYDIPDVDCVNDALENAVTSYFEVTPTEVKPAFSVSARAWTWRIVRVR